MPEETPELPVRVPGVNLPPAAYETGFKAPNVSDEQWRLNEQALRVLLNGLRRWQVNGR